MLVLVLSRYTCFTQHDRAEEGNRKRKGETQKKNVALNTLSCFLLTLPALPAPNCLGKVLVPDLVLCALVYSSGQTRRSRPSLVVRLFTGNVPDLERSRDRRDRGTNNRQERRSKRDKTALSTLSSRPRGDKFNLVF